LYALSTDDNYTDLDWCDTEKKYVIVVKYKDISKIKSFFFDCNDFICLANKLETYPKLLKEKNINK